MVPGYAWGILVFAFYSYLWSGLPMLDRFQTGGVRPIRAHAVQSYICDDIASLTGFSQISV